MAATAKSLPLAAVEAQLRPVAVMLDFVNPALPP